MVTLLVSRSWEWPGLHWTVFSWWPLGRRWEVLKYIGGLRFIHTGAHPDTQYMGFHSHIHRMESRVHTQSHSSVYL